MKKLLLNLIIFSSLLGLASCNQKQIGPVFLGEVDGLLPTSKVYKGDYFDLFHGVNTSDANNKEVNVKILSLGGFDINTIGSYEIVYEASDNKGNSTIATKTIIVIEKEFNNDLIIFDNSNNGFLPTLTINKGDNVDLLENVIAVDEKGRLASVSVYDETELNYEVSGIYIITYKAEDLEGNISFIKRKYYSYK